MPIDHHKNLKDWLNTYLTTWAGPKGPVDSSTQRLVTRSFIEFIESSHRVAFRDHLPGHLTGSALVVNETMDQVLLTLHSKLGLWLQLGGHADGNPRLPEVAAQEAFEESALADLEFVTTPFFRPIDASAPGIFDLDCHWIPPRGPEPGHYHYDVRYLMRTRTPEKIAITPESQELRWFALKDAYPLSPHRSMSRQFDKVNSLRKTINTALNSQEWNAVDPV